MENLVRYDAYCYWWQPTTKRINDVVKLLSAQKNPFVFNFAGHKIDTLNRGSNSIFLRKQILINKNINRNGSFTIIFANHHSKQFNYYSFVNGHWWSRATFHAPIAVSSLLLLFINPPASPIAFVRFFAYTTYDYNLIKVMCWNISLHFSYSFFFVLFFSILCVYRCGIHIRSYQTYPFQWRYNKFSMHNIISYSNNQTYNSLTIY